MFGLQCHRIIVLRQSWMQYVRNVSRKTKLRSIRVAAVSKHGQGVQKNTIAIWKKWTEGKLKAQDNHLRGIKFFLTRIMTRWKSYVAGRMIKYDRVDLALSLWVPKTQQK